MKTGRVTGAPRAHRTEGTPRPAGRGAEIMPSFINSPLKAAFALLVIASCAAGEDAADRPGPTPLAPDPECPAACSPDGQSVVDCHGALVTSCAAYASCFDAECIGGCEAAGRAQSSIGCEYYAAKPSADVLFGGYDASCYAVLVANTWNAPVELQVEYDGKPISSSYFRIPRGRGKDIRYELLPEGKLPKDELAILFLAMQTKPPFSPGSFYLPCPPTVGAAIVGQTEVRGSGHGKMFHIKSSAPVIAYDIYPYGGADSFLPAASLLFPTSAWGTENLAMTGYAATDETHIRQGFYPYFQILAREDDTRVKIRPTATLSSAGGRPEVAAGETGELVLQRGEFVQYTQLHEMNGTAVESDKPVALAGGATCMNIPNTLAACDTLHQYLPPIRLMGDHYVATRYRDREEPETTPWRILAGANGTRLTYDPPVPDAPTTLERGEWKEFWAPGPFVVKSQDEAHPIYVGSYMTAGQMVAVDEGDPDWVNVVPTGQHLSSYVFLTDPTFGNTNLVFVRGPVDGAYADVELDCVGAVQGWKKVGGSGYEVAYVDLVRKGAPQGLCDNGVHRASSKNPFALTVWGFDFRASYGYPAGSGTKTLNEVPAIR